MPVRGTGMKKLMVVALVALAQPICVGPVSTCRQEPSTRPATPARDYSQWEKEIAAFEEADRSNPPSKGTVLFIGSSTVKLWKTLAEDFPDHHIVNRGFGGSEIRDATHFADRIIIPCRPRQIFLRAGSNDIHGGRLPSEVARDFSEFVRVVHDRLPDAEIAFIGTNPAPSRWSEKDKLRDLNRRIRQMALEMPRVSYVDVFDLGIDRDGRPRHKLFLSDMLHFNADGYKLLADRVRPFLIGTR
jgi:lysophospholipase L1-like esterase